MEQKIIDIIINSLKDLNFHNKNLINNVEETPLFGSNSELDSLGLVNLIVSVEQYIEDAFHVVIVIADDRALSQKYSPFKTVGSLANYIEILLKEKLDD